MSVTQALLTARVDLYHACSVRLPIRMAVDCLLAFKSCFRYPAYWPITG